MTEVTELGVDMSQGCFAPLYGVGGSNFRQDKFPLDMLDLIEVSCDNLE